MHHLRLGLYLVLGLSAASPAFAQSVTINGVPIEAIGAGKAYIQPDGSVVQGIGFKATPPGATQPSYYQRAVQYTKGTVGGNIKQFAKFSAYSLVFTGILQGIGWGLDQITGDIYSTPAQDVFCGGSYGQCVNYYGGLFGRSFNTCQNTSSPQSECFSSVSQAASVAQARYNAYITSLGGDAFITCQGISLGNNGIKCTDVVGSVTYAHANLNTRPAPVAVQSTPAVQPTNEQVAEQIAPKLDQETLDKLATHPQTGAVKQTQEVLDKMTEIANQLAKEADPANTPVSAPTASPTANTTDTPQAAGTNVPAFCVWAKPVCDVIDWFKEPAQPAPEDNADFTFAGIIDENEIEVQSFSSGLGGGTCPDPKTADVLGANLSFSFQPLCDLAGVARIFVLLFAYISSIYILLGMKRS